MTDKEQKTILELRTIVFELRDENNKYREDLKNQVEVLRSQVERKLVPFNLEQDITKKIQESVGEAISKTLTGYDSPLLKLTKAVVDERSVELKEIISASFNQVIKTEAFKASIVNAFSHKAARTIISNNDGLFERVANDLKQDAIFKAKMALAVSTVVEEVLTERKANR